MDEYPTILELPLDSETPFQIHLFDEQDQAEDLDFVSDAVLEIKASVSGAVLVTRRLSLATMSKVDSALQCDALSSAESDLLSDGSTYIADLVVLVSGAWHRTDRFYLVATGGVTEIPS